MNNKGYDAVKLALSSHNINADVVPEPEEGANVPYVTIVSKEGPLFGAHVLNALDEADLGENRGVMNRRKGPELVVKSQTETTITFLDKLPH